MKTKLLLIALFASAFNTATLKSCPITAYTFGIQNVSCSGGSDGTVSAGASTGTAPFSYLWSTGSTNSTISALSAGTYSFTVTDNNGCTGTATATIGQPSPISISLQDMSCNSGGLINSMVSGGTPIYFYAWSDPGSQTNQNATGLSAGSYTLTVTDLNGCTASSSLAITIPAALTASASVINNVSCQTGTNGSASVSVGGGTAPYTYNWTGGQTTATATGLWANTFTVYVFDAHNCTASATVVITQPPGLGVWLSGIQSSCFSSNTGTATANPTGGTSPYTYSWNPGGQTNATASGLSTGNYTVTITDNNGCTASASCNISSYPSLTASAWIVTNVNCYGGNNGTANSSGTGGSWSYTYSWSNGETNATATGLTAGSYTITVTDSHGCTATAMTVVNQPTVLSVGASAGANVTCFGMSNGSATASASGGTPSYNYMWSNFAVGGTIYGLSAGTYTVTTTDWHGCTATASVIITQPSQLSVVSNQLSGVSCNGGSNGSATLTASGGTSPYTYLWMPYSQTTITATGLVAGYYTITVHDNNGCTATASVMITQPPALSVSANVRANVSCYGGNNGIDSAAPLGGTKPYTYLWTGGGTNRVNTGLIAGNYTITVTDSCGATASANSTITQPTTVLSVTASAQNSVLCGGIWDSLFSAPSGGTSPYTYAWTPAPFGDLSCSTCKKTNAMPFGTTYTITVTDNHGCTATATAGITVIPPPYLTVTGPLSPVCAGNSDTLVASGFMASSFLWSTGATTSQIIVSPSVSTTYTVKAYNMFGCYDTAHYFLDTTCHSGNGTSSSSTIKVMPSGECNLGSYSSLDSVVWFSFVPTDSNTQIVAISDYLGYPVPHVHHLTLYNSSFNTVKDEPMPDITGASELRLDVSHLHIGSTYYILASRAGAHSNMSYCNPTPSPTGVCNESMRWSFQLCVRMVPVFIPKDSGCEPPAVTQLYYEGRGQIQDLNRIPRFDIKAYTNFAPSPAVYCSDSTVSFVYAHTDTAKSFIDTLQRVDMVLTGSGVQPPQRCFKMEEDTSAGYLNYFLGFAPNGVPGIYGYSRLVYKNVYENVDMHLYSNTDGTKLYFVCNPPAGGGGAGNPSQIEMQFKGATSVNVTADSGLNVVTELGTLSFTPGYAYEDSAGIIKPTTWHANFEVVNATTVRFHTGPYNTNEPLIIRVDRGHRPNPSPGLYPGLLWSTYFGGVVCQDNLNDVCNDNSGNVYAAGATQASDYPVTTGVFQGQISNSFDENATVAKFNSSHARKWATYYGGTNYTTAFGVGVDGSGNVYITGSTLSPDLPGIKNQSSGNFVQQYLNNTPNDITEQDAFITMFSNDGKNVYWTTWYGGAGASEWGRHLTIDGNNNLYVVGGYAEANAITTFPLKASAKAGAYNESAYGTGFILEFDVSNPSAVSLEWATRIGDNNTSSSLATLLGCTVDASNNFYVTGLAVGNGYTSPTVPTYAFNGAGGGANAVVTKFNSNNNVVWSSYYGGTLGESGNAITVDPNGNTFITGWSYSDPSYMSGIETKQLGGGFIQWSNNGYTGGVCNGFIAEFNASGVLQWGTYFGGSTGILSCEAILNDGLGNIYITGVNHETDMPLPASNPPNTFSHRIYYTGALGQDYDAFIIAFSNVNSSPTYEWGTYFGSDWGTGICLYNNQYLYIVGNLGDGNTPQYYPTGSYQQPNFFASNQNNVFLGTSFISEFNVGPISSVNNISKSPDGIDVYPNPTSHSITVQMKLNQKENVEFTLYNSIGQVVYNRILSELPGTINEEIDVSLLSNGIYLLKINEGDKYFTKKIVKQE